jgi:hypothetical protein
MTAALAQTLSVPAGDRHEIRFAVRVHRRLHAFRLFDGRATASENSR